MHRDALNGRDVFISPIASNLLLGSDKDIEDAKHLNVLFQEHLNHDTLRSYVDVLHQTAQPRRYLGTN